MRFPGYTDEWRECTIDEIAKTEKGSGISKEQLSDEGEECILYGELYTKYKSEIINEVYSKTGIDSSRLTRSQANDVIIPCSGETAEDIATARCVTKDGVLLGGDLNIIRFDKQDGAFMSYQLNGKRKYDIARVAQGVSVVHLYPDHLKSVKVNIPELGEQQKIVRLLSLIDERIATQNKIIEDLKKLKSAISVQLFESHNVPYDSNMWKIVSLGDITENFHHRNKNSDSYPMYSVTNTSGFTPQHEVFEGKEIKDEDISIYKIIHKGEFAYNPARINVGSIGRYDEETPCMISSLYVCFRPTAEVDSDWLLYYLQSDKKIYQYGIFGEGGVRIYLFYPNFSRIEALLPPLKIQKEIASILKSFNQKIKLEESLLSKYQGQKKFLLSSMFI